MAATNSVRTFAAIAYNEVLLNTKRVAPYALIIVFSAIALMGWVRGGPAVALGWATNSDFYIARSLKAFSFLLGPPLFTAVIMGNPVIRDFRLGIDPLIFSKPINRAQYLFGKFFGNFCVLVCCMAAFPLTLLVLQAFRPLRMVVQQAQVLPYFKHFFFFVVITHLTLAAFYFTVGALTRNSKIVYGLAICFYPIYIAAMLFLLSPLRVRWRNFFDAFLLNSGPSNNGFGNSADFLNSYVVSYTPDMIGNRVLLILTAAICLTVLYLRFRVAERPGNLKRTASMFGLATLPDQVYYHSESAREQRELKQVIMRSNGIRTEVVPIIAKTRKGFSSTFAKIIAPLNPFRAIFQAEVLLNTKRVAPYVVALLCGGNALLWWGWGPATGRGWATNSDFFIAGVLPVYSFLFLPLYTAIIMADPAIRDFSAGIDPLIFSKPVSRAQYLLGKFFGNFFTLACCQSAFVLTLFVLQWVPKQGMIVQEPKCFLYPKHFIVFVAISHLLLAAFYFTVGTLTRNAKIVYGLGILFYPLIITYNLAFLNKLPSRWAIILDPLVMRWNNLHTTKVEVINRLVVVYDSNLIINRSLMILLTAICLTILYLRFSTTERSGPVEKFSVINLSTAAERVYYPESSQPLLDEFETPYYKAGGRLRPVAIPEVVTANEGIRANVNKLIAALGVEFRLLRAERSIVVVVPLAIFLSTLEVAFYNIPPDVSHSAAYAANTAKLLLLFLIGIAVFYTGEAMHRDREVRIEPVIWSTPAPNSVLLLSKCLATVVLTLSLLVVVGLTAIVIQLVRRHTPVDVSGYLMVYGVVLVPGIIFMVAVVVALNVLLRNKYLAYVVAVGAGTGLFYLYNNGYKHWSYNPLLYQLWKYQDLTSPRILAYRLYWFALAAACLALAHLFFERKSK